MHIPSQADRSGAAHAGATPAGEGAAAPVEELRARRLHLVQQLRSVGYWQRLVRARTDLLVAGLLYGAPVPGAPTWVPPAAGGPDLHDLPGLDDLSEPPEGLDLGHLLEAPGGSGRVQAEEGERLDRLRAAATVLAGRSRGLQEELDEVTVALHHRLASDGADEARPTGPVPLAPLSR